MFVKVSDEIIDYDLDLLTDVLSMIDAKLTDMFAEATKLPDPDAVGLSTRIENLAGLGFAACQTYLSTTSGALKIDKGDALDAGPADTSGARIAVLVNAAADYWKHRDEWSSDPKKRRLRMLERLQPLRIDPRAAHLCTAVLAHLVSVRPPRFSDLVPSLVQWRNSLETK